MAQARIQWGLQRISAAPCSFWRAGLPGAADGVWGSPSPCQSPKHAPSLHGMLAHGLDASAHAACTCPLLPCWAFACTFAQLKRDSAQGSSPRSQSPALHPACAFTCLGQPASASLPRTAFYHHSFESISCSVYDPPRCNTPVTPGRLLWAGCEAWRLWPRVRTPLPAIPLRSNPCSDRINDRTKSRAVHGSGRRVAGPAAGAYGLVGVCPCCPDQFYSLNFIRGKPRDPLVPGETSHETASPLLV